MTPQAEKSELRPAKRRELIESAVKKDYPVMGKVALELPATIIHEAFPDILLFDWCEAVNLGYRINTNPLPEFNSSTTIIFWELPPRLDETLLPYNDDDL